MSEQSSRPAQNGGAGWMHRLTNEPLPKKVIKMRSPGGPKPIKTTRYEAIGPNGELVATHVRNDYEDGDKEVLWYGPDGKKGIKRLGLGLSDMPLYNLPALLAADPARVVVVCEGEKSTDALTSIGVLAVGTMTGADTIPGPAALLPLVGRSPLLWPDNDDDGRSHMDRFARGLHAQGTACCVLEWPEAPPKGDAADFVGDGFGKDELVALYESAITWSPPEADEDTASDGVASDGTFRLTDIGNAQRLVARHGPHIRWCDEMGQWFRWDGTRWQQVSATILQDLAKETADSLWDEAVAAQGDEYRAAVFKHAKSSGSSRAISAMVTLSKTVVGSIAIDAELLDADLLLLGVENGTVDLRTGELKPPNREDFITRSCRAPFDPNAECPQWEKFLERIFGGDADLMAYVQRAVGYSLTGLTGERVIFIEHGSGANGKSTFQDQIRYLMGSYATTTPIETLITRKDKGIGNDVARLKSARFVSATESERGHQLAEAFIKQMTGGDQVAARFLHKEYFEFTPRLKLWLATNHRPEISGGGKAIWTRLQLVPFLVEIPVEERDQNLKAKLVAESAGILAWAVRGCLEWQEIGLCPPKAITDANRGYEEDEDVLGTWIEDCAVVEQNVWCSVGDLFTSFDSWREGHGEEKMSAKAFSQALSERSGLLRSRQLGTRTRGFRGIRLLEVQTRKKKRQEDGLDE